MEPKGEMENMEMWKKKFNICSNRNWLLLTRDAQTPNPRAIDSAQKIFLILSWKNLLMLIPAQNAEDALLPAPQTLQANS